MSLSEDLSEAVKDIFATSWESRDGEKIPETEDVGLGNDAVAMVATVLYADLAESTSLVDTHPRAFAAEVYKSYLHCASKIIRSEGGEITAFDGDRVMGVFIGGSKNTSAARAALKINFCVAKIINPALAQQYPDKGYTIRQAVGIDTSTLFIARTGVRGSNDLVWVGRAANYAAKLCSLRQGTYASWITEDVYQMLSDEAKFTNGKNMWEAVYWDERDMTVYRSSWTWKP